MLKPIIGIIIVLVFSAGIAVAGSQGSSSVASISLFLFCASIGFILHWLVFIPSFIFQTEKYFDLTGSISYVVIVAVAASHHPNLDARGLLLCIMIGVWAVRLGSFLFMRVRKDGRDRRFDEIKTKFFRFLFTWTLGGAWVFITMAAGLAAITSINQAALDMFFMVGFALWIFGFSFEVIADRQKTAFRAEPENKDKFVTTGLWSYSRHPNYFGEILLWFGISLIAFPTLSGWQLVTLLSPIFVTLLLIKVSGINLLEASGMKRWGADESYQKYLASTSILIPLPKKNLE